MASESAIPTVDLASFLVDGEEEPKKGVIELVSHACLEYRFLQVVNHGILVQLMKMALAWSRAFFDCPAEEKLMPAGYARQPKNSTDKNEFSLMLLPGSIFNVYPTNPPDSVDEMFKHFVKTGRIIENIINESLGLLPNHLADYDGDRTWDPMSTFRFFPVTEEGRELHHIRVRKGHRYVSANHQVVRQARKRHSYAFCLQRGWGQSGGGAAAVHRWLQSTKGFVYKAYLQLGLRSKTNPPPKPEDVISIKHQAITT